MDNMGENTDINESSEAKSPVSISRLKEYGKKAYAPLVNVVFKYQDEFTPYLNALSKGLEGGVNALNKEGSSEAERYVSQFFKEAADGIKVACQKLDAKDPKAFTDYVSEMAEKRPSIMFSTSYIAGLFFGRLGKHIAKSRNQKTNVNNDLMTNEPPSFDQSIH